MSARKPKAMEQKAAKEAKKDPQLLPCPFCGSRAELTIGDGGYIWANCSNIDCMAMTADSKRASSAARIWNTRVPSLPSLPSVQNSPSGQVSK